MRFESGDSGRELLIFPENSIEKSFIGSLVGGETNIPFKYDKPDPRLVCYVREGAEIVIRSLEHSNTSAVKQDSFMLGLGSTLSDKDIATIPAFIKLVLEGDESGEEDIDLEAIESISGRIKTLLLNLYQERR